MYSPPDDTPLYRVDRRWCALPQAVRWLGDFGRARADNQSFVVVVVTVVLTTHRDTNAWVFNVNDHRRNMSATARYWIGRSVGMCARTYIIYTNICRKESIGSVRIMHTHCRKCNMNMFRKSFKKTIYLWKITASHVMITRLDCTYTSNVLGATFNGRPHYLYALDEDPIFPERNVDHRSINFLVHVHIYRMNGNSVFLRHLI